MEQEGNEGRPKCAGITAIQVCIDSNLAWPRLVYSVLRFCFCFLKLNFYGLLCGLKEFGDA